MSDTVLVSPIPRRRPVLTLVDLALEPEGPTPEQLQLDPNAGIRWMGGFRWQPSPCGGAWGMIDGCASPHDELVDPVMIPVIDTGSELPEYYPPRVYTFDQCTTLAARDLSYFTDRVQTSLDVATPKLVGLEFWDAPVSRAIAARGEMPGLHPTVPNPHLAQSGLAQDMTPASGAVTIERGYALLEEFLGSCGFGQQGMIHARRDCIPSFGVRRPTGSKFLLTHMDTIVVPDPGYTGTGPGNVVPADGEAWMYATGGMVTVRISDIEVLANGGPLSETIITRQNTVEVQASRYIAATVDGDCCVGAVRVQLD